ncbi:DUF2628 domain-containing protein [Camelimonas abortus]|uniref:DUF2628 domain-containing protein n=1 Tax=Camelimonas abortus TaxID=1017184 RepID=A0ABV7LCB1_9HYPH
MRAYLLHVPAVAGAPDRKAQAERAVVVRDGFSWPAFIAPPLWFLWRRCWLAALGAIVADGAWLGFAGWSGMPPLYLASGLAVIHMFAGLEAGEIQGRALARRGFRLADVQVARTRDEAEGALLRRFAAGATEEKVRVTLTTRSGADIVGLFPEPEVSR